MSLFKFRRFRLKDKDFLKEYVERYSPKSCEYNFANLFAWQDIYDITWTLYEGRLLIYDGLSQYAFMPLGKDLYPEELVILSLNLKKEGLRPNFGLVTKEYIEKYPGLSEYYEIEELRDSAEYIYDVNSLVELTGTKLQKKKNLIAQFKKYYPQYEVVPLTNEYRDKALAFCKGLLDRRKRRSKTLDQEFDAIRISFEYFDALNLEGLAILVEGRMAAMAVFSRISPSTYDIQFEKSDPDFKGVGQMINYETAKYLQVKCRYLNREQDLGIKGLRQAKLSYDPVELMTTYGINMI